MVERFGCDPRDAHVGIGPSLGPCCAEFTNYRQEIPSELWGYRRDSVRFDFWAMSRDQLIRAGVPRDQIQISGLCTKCRTDRFFSYRAEKTTGRFPAVIGLRHAGAGVRDLDRDRAIGRAGADRHDAAVLDRVRGVGDQVDQHLLELARHGVERRDVVGELDPDLKINIINI